MTAYHRAVLLIIIGGVFLSSSGIAIRSLEAASGMQIVFYRALGMAVFMALAVLWQHKANTVLAFRSIDKQGILAGVFFSLASFAIVYALLNTTVANAMFIVSLAPLFAAVLAWFFLHETVQTRTWLAIGLACLGVLVMVGGALSGDGMLGILYAFVMAISYGAFSVCIRAGRGSDMIPAICVSGFALAGVSSLWVADFSLPTNDLLICLGLGVFQVGIGGLCLTIAAKHVPAAQITLLAMLEVVLNPLWVWLGIGETPALATLIGGAMILCAITYQARSTQQSNSDKSLNNV